MPNDIKVKLLVHFAFFGIETWMFASIFSHLTSKALTVVFQARGVIVYGSDQEVRCWKSLFVCMDLLAQFEACREKFNIPCCFPLTICASYNVSVSWWLS